jgi:hypothetical protein
MALSVSEPIPGRNSLEVRPRAGENRMESMAATEQESSDDLHLRNPERDDRIAWQRPIALSAGASDP